MKNHFSDKALVGDFAPQSLENFGNIRCGVCFKASTVLIALHQSKGVAMGRKKKDIGVKEKRITIRVSEAL